MTVRTLIGMKSHADLMDHFSQVRLAIMVTRSITSTLVKVGCRLVGAGTLNFRHFLRFSVRKVGSINS